jgi:outer membrane protein assembly factor BamB
MIYLSKMPALCISALLVFARLTTAADWPMFSGPNGNFTVPESGLEIVNSFDGVRKLWESEENDIGDAKCCYNVIEVLDKGWKYHPGGQAHPIVAENTVFVSYYRPMGELATNSSIRKVPSIDVLDSVSGRPESFYGIRSDDVLLAVDASSGQTKWKRVQEGKGINTVQSKRPGYGVGPVYYDGRVFSLGTAGRLYCYDAETGDDEWEVTVPGLYEQLATELAEALEEKEFVKNPRMLTSLVEAEGIIICPHANGTISGVNPDNGEFEWTVEDVQESFATPAIFHYGDREYLLCQNGQGTMSLLDPQTGGIQWQVDGLGPMLFTLVPSDSRVIVSAVATEKGTNTHWACYQITDQSATKEWETPDYRWAWWNDDGAGRKIGVGDEVFYFAVTYKNDNDPYGVYALNASDGSLEQHISPESVPKAYNWFSQPLQIEDKLLVFTDYRHGASSFNAVLISVADDGTLTKLDAGHPFEGIATGYEVDLQPAYADGVIYFRTEAGRLAAYDLRADESSVRSGHSPGLQTTARTRNSLRLTNKGLEIVSASGKAGRMHRFDLQGRRIKNNRHSFGTSRMIERLP